MVGIALSIRTVYHPVVFDVDDVHHKCIIRTHERRVSAACDALGTVELHDAHDTGLAAEVATPRPDLDNRRGQETEAAWAEELRQPVEFEPLYREMSRYLEPRNELMCLLKADQAIGVDLLDGAFIIPGKVLGSVLHRPPKELDVDIAADSFHRSGSD